MRVDTDIKLGFRDVLIKPKRSTLKSRSEVSLLRTFKFKHSGFSWEGYPIVAANMDTIGTFEMAEALAHRGLLTAIHKHYSLDEWKESFIAKDPKLGSFVMASCGVSEDDFEKLKKILSLAPGIKFICLDVANGYTQLFVDHVKRLRETFPTKTLIAGNVVTPEMTEELILSGADVVKVGIGPGSVCTTRLKTGVGYPQLSAVIECADAAHGLRGQIISDGGCTKPGDVAKALAAGGDFVMLGGMFSGYEEGGGEDIQKNGKRYRRFYGMSSSVAMKKHSGGLAEYRASEGKCVLVPYKGEVSSIVKDILGGVRSTCTYVGAVSLKELSKRTTFIRVFEQENQIFTQAEESLS